MVVFIWPSDVDILPAGQPFPDGVFALLIAGWGGSSSRLAPGSAAMEVIKVKREKSFIFCGFGVGNLFQKVIDQVLLTWYARSSPADKSVFILTPDSIFINVALRMCNSYC